MFQLFQYVIVTLSLLAIPTYKLIRWYFRNAYISNDNGAYEGENVYGKHAN